jgi:hypothetical protein
MAINVSGQRTSVWWMLQGSSITNEAYKGVLRDVFQPVVD